MDDLRELYLHPVQENTLFISVGGLMKMVGAKFRMWNSRVRFPGILSAG